LNPRGKDYHNYGARGIVVASPWVESFATFAAYVDEHLGPCPKGYSLDRINNNGGYEPGNVRWASAVTQGNNRRPNMGLRGDQHPEAKLTNENVREIRELIATYPQRGVLAFIARSYGVTAPAIFAIKTDKTWRHCE
jgi:hypothetical protein